MQVTLVLAVLVHFVSVYSYEERQGGLFIAITSVLVFVPFGLLGAMKINDKMKRRTAARNDLEDSEKDEICEGTEQKPARRCWCCCHRRQTAVQQKKKKPMQRGKELSNEGVTQIKILSSVIDQHKHAALRTVELIYEQKIALMQETDKAHAADKARLEREEQEAAHTAEVGVVDNMKNPALTKRLPERGLEVEGKRDELRRVFFALSEADLLSAEENDNTKAIDLISEDGHAEHDGLGNEQRQVDRYAELEEDLKDKLEIVAAKFDALQPTLRDLKEQTNNDPRRNDLDFTTIFPVMDAYVVQLRELAEQKKHMLVSAEEAAGQMQDSQEEMRYKIAYLQLLLREYDKDIDDEFIDVFTTGHGPRSCHLTMLASAVRRSDIARLCVKFGLIKQVQIRPTSAAFDGIGWAIVVFHHARAARDISRTGAPLLIANKPVCAIAVGNHAWTDSEGASATTPARPADPLEEMRAAEPLLAIDGIGEPREALATAGALPVGGRQPVGLPLQVSPER
jgi:hypothetical protein